MLFLTQGVLDLLLWLLTRVHCWCLRTMYVVDPMTKCIAFRPSSFPVRPLDFQCGLWFWGPNLAIQDSTLSSAVRSSRGSDRRRYSVGCGSRAAAAIPGRSLGRGWPMTCSSRRWLDLGGCALHRTFDQSVPKISTSTKIPPALTKPRTTTRPAIPNPNPSQNPPTTPSKWPRKSATLRRYGLAAPGASELCN